MGKCCERIRENWFWFGCGSFLLVEGIIWGITRNSDLVLLSIPIAMGFWFIITGVVMSIPKKNKNQETPSQGKQDKDRKDEINFIFDFALAIYGVALSLSAYQAHTAKIFTPGDILFYKFDNLVSTLVFGIFLLITVSVFAFCWYNRNRLWDYSPFRIDTHVTKVIKVLFALLLGVSPWLVYYFTYWLKYSIHLIP
jgi:hypothetical protein